MYMTRTYWIVRGIDVEQDRYSLAPIHVVGSGIKQAQIELKVCSIIFSQNGTFGRLIEVFYIRLS